jgi:hypothetical protein
MLRVGEKVMRFLLIDADKRTVTPKHANDLRECYATLGLDLNSIDHGVVARSPHGTIAIVVYEFGLMEPPAMHNFFSIGQQLYAGNAVLYAADATGETMDLELNLPVMFYRSSKEAETAIQRGDIQRPQTAVNGKVIWQWKG